MGVGGWVAGFGQKLESETVFPSSPELVNKEQVLKYPRLLILNGIKLSF